MSIFQRISSFLLLRHAMRSLQLLLIVFGDACILLIASAGLCVDYSRAEISLSVSSKIGWLSLSLESFIKSTRKG